MISDLTFKLLLHFEFTFVFGVKVGQNFKRHFTSHLTFAVQL